MKVLWVQAAQQDRADIVEYIAIENPRAALKMDDLFGEAAARLADFLKIGKIGLIPGTRELLPHESYRLVYELDEVGETVWIMAVVHTARQWPPALPHPDR
ncbi:type II toxin-antitoxin system RelE/ParE family toxin [Azotobacter vinelandii]|uniref:type II toxin-antitoxin system RelE/ParE family toxin n=1 Tax=Azotobacter vinelandii TaxID=354 RepID=UPI0007740B84|nr:type II toxin-antitoxin system RelE/ParE family toxin [Azotobacter vinelandii]